MQQSYILILTIIVLVGAFGGVINYFMLVPADGAAVAQPVPSKGSLLIRSLFMGIAAAILVPLFLNTISSAVLTDLIAGSNVYKNSLIFAGFCLLAAISSRRFIDDLYTRVMKIEDKADAAKGAADEARLNAHKAMTETQDLVNASTEPKKTKLKGMRANAAPAIVSPEADNEAKLIAAFAGSKYIYRTLDGLVADSGLSDTDAQTALQSLQQKGKVKSRLDADGDTVWQVVPE